MSLYPPFPVLLVDDEEPFLSSLSMLLKRKLFVNNIRTCSDPTKVLSMMAAEAISVVILDLMMPKLSGESLLSKIKIQFPDTPVIILTGMDQITTAVSCVKNGAYDFFVKTGDAGRILQGIKRAIRLHELQMENRELTCGFLRDTSWSPVVYGNFASRSTRMIRIVRFLEAVASLPAPILFVGEPGTGKRELAAVLHGLGRSTRPMAEVDSAAVGDFGQLLLGTEESPGLLHQVSGGSLIIKRIEFLSQTDQQLLRNLMDTGGFSPIGSKRILPFSGRLLATSSLPLDDLQQMAQSLVLGFSPNIIQVPALRNRREDLPIILDHLFDECSSVLGKSRPTVPADLLAIFAAYHFPGNFAELKDIVLEALDVHPGGMVMSLNTFKAKVGPVAEHLEQQDLVSFNGTRLPTMEEMERLLLAEAERRASGNQGVMASLLGLSRTAVNKRLKKICRS